jgi:N-acetylmuramoyl-L-alanine amidase
LRRARVRRVGLVLAVGTAGVWAAGAVPAIAGRRLVEKDVNLDVARRTTAVLRARGVRVQMTRDSDVFIPLGDRTGLARRVGADAFISIHHNAGPSSRSGTEIYRQVRSDGRLAQAVAGAWRERIPGRSVQVIARPNSGGGDYYFVLRTSPMPALIVEGGYITNGADARRLDDPAFRQAEAEATANGVVRWLGIGPVDNTPAPDLPQGSRTTVDALPKPTGLAAAVPDRRHVTLDWRSASVVEAYRIYRDGHLLAVVDNPTRTTTSTAPLGFTDAWVNPGTTYHYEVRAVALKGDNVLESTAATASATTPPGPLVVIDPGHGAHDPGASTIL